ncbi:MAG: hypothetical protein ACFFDI_32680, partial [Promethearchaeota archaeon]
MFYGLILDIVLFIVALIGIIYGWYGLVNTLYEQPIMILTPENIFLGNNSAFDFINEFKSRALFLRF